MNDFDIITTQLIIDYLKAKYGYTKSIEIITTSTTPPYNNIIKNVKLNEIDNIKYEELNSKSYLRLSCNIINEPNIKYRFYESLINILVFIYSKDTY